LIRKLSRSDSGSASPRPVQNIPFGLAQGTFGASHGAEFFGSPTTCRASQCSIALPSASILEMSTPAIPVSAGSSLFGDVADRQADAPSGGALQILYLCGGHCRPEYDIAPGSEPERDIAAEAAARAGDCGGATRVFRMVRHLRSPFQSPVSAPRGRSARLRFRAARSSASSRPFREMPCSSGT
jgi:hypothetical protein